MKKRVVAVVGLITVLAVALGMGVSTALASNDARSLLRIGQARLVDPAGVSLGTVQLVELSGRLNVIGKVRGSLCLISTSYGRRHSSDWRWEPAMGPI